MKGWQALPEERCGNCKYFRQHYIQSSRGVIGPCNTVIASTPS